MLKILKYELIQGWRSYALTFGIFLAACVAIAVLPINIAAIAGTVLMLSVLFRTTGIPCSSAMPI